MSCPDCFKGAVHEGEPKGKIQDIHGVKTYVTLPNDNPNPKSTIIFYTDAFGLNLPNNKLVADTYAVHADCRVLVPDIIPGGGASLSTMHNMNTLLKPIGSWLGLLNPLMYLGKGYAFGVVLTNMVPFMIRANPGKAFPTCVKYARDVRAGMPADGKLGVAGFCWGGFQTTKMCTQKVTEGGSKPLIDAQFNAHPSALAAPDDFVDAVAAGVPYSSAVAEFDFMFNKTVAENTEAAIRKKLGEGVGTYEFKVYEGAHHGFSVRASHDEGEVGKNGYEGATRQAVDWFNKYLH